MSNDELRAKLETPGGSGEPELWKVVRDAVIQRNPFYHDEDGWRQVTFITLAALSPAPALDDEGLALLREARDTFELAAAVPLADPYIVVELRDLCERHGYGNVMASASALWRQRLGEQAGGEFVASPCRGTAINQLARIDAYLAKQRT